MSMSLTRGGATRDERGRECADPRAMCIGGVDTLGFKNRVGNFVLFPRQNFVLRFWCVHCVLDGLVSVQE